METTQTRVYYYGAATNSPPERTPCERDLARFPGHGRDEGLNSQQPPSLPILAEAHKHEEEEERRRQQQRRIAGISFTLRACVLSWERQQPAKEGERERRGGIFAGNCVYTTTTSTPCRLSLLPSETFMLLMSLLLLLLPSLSRRCRCTYSPRRRRRREGGSEEEEVKSGAFARRLRCCEEENGAMNLGKEVSLVRGREREREKRIHYSRRRPLVVYTSRSMLRSLRPGENGEMRGGKEVRSHCFSWSVSFLSLSLSLFVTPDLY